MYLESSALFDDPNWEEIRSLAKLVAEEMVGHQLNQSNKNIEL